MRRTKGLTDDVDDAAPMRPPTRRATPTPSYGLGGGASSIRTTASNSTIASSDIPAPPVLRNRNGQAVASAATSRVPPESAVDSSTTRATRNPQSSGTQGPARAKGRVENHKQSSQQEESMSEGELQVKSYMVSIDSAPNSTHSSTMPPGAIPVQGINSRSSTGAAPDIDQWDNVGEASERGEDDDTHAISTLPSTTLSTSMGATPQIVAQLAPNDDDVAARVAEQLQRQITSEWKERLKEEVKAQLNTERQSHMVVEAVTVSNNSGDDVEAPSSPSNSQKGRDDDFKICGFKRQTCGCMMILLLLIVGGGVAGALFALGGDDDTTEMPTTSPTSQPTVPKLTASPTESDTRLKYLMETLGEYIAPTPADLALIESSTTPQGQAMAWLSELDTYSQDPESLSTSELLERYALAVLYYSTSGPNWTIKLSFLKASSACSWNIGDRDLLGQNAKGAYCESTTEPESVTFISLHELGLSGTMPWEISLLENLESLYLETNSLTGSIPTQFAQLTNLLSFWITFNAFTGDLPLEMPDSLEDLDISDNYFSGSLPSSWATSMPNLKWLSVGLNSIHGTLPPEWGILTTLEYIDFEGNNISGTIPPEIGELTRLMSLFFELNSLTGTIPTQLAQLVDLEILFVYSNVDLTGTVPTEFSELLFLDDFFFEDTSLTGSVDGIFCNRTTLPSSLRGDCLGDTPEIECTCCHYCCSAQGELCRRMS